VHIRSGLPTRPTISLCRAGWPTTSGGRSSIERDVTVWMGDQQIVRSCVVLARIYLEHHAVADGDDGSATGCCEVNAEVHALAGAIGTAPAGKCANREG